MMTRWCATVRASQAALFWAIWYWIWHSLLLPIKEENSGWPLHWHGRAWLRWTEQKWHIATVPFFKFQLEPGFQFSPGHVYGGKCAACPGGGAKYNWFRFWLPHTFCFLLRIRELLSVWLWVTVIPRGSMNVYFDVSEWCEQRWWEQHPCVVRMTDCVDLCVVMFLVRVKSHAVPFFCPRRAPGLGTLLFAVPCLHLRIFLMMMITVWNLGRYHRRPGTRYRGTYPDMSVQSEKFREDPCWIRPNEPCSE